MISNVVTSYTALRFTAAVLLYYFSKHLAAQLHMPQLHYLRTLCFLHVSAQRERSAIWPQARAAVQLSSLKSAKR